MCSYTFLESSQASGEETHTCSVCVCACQAIEWALEWALAAGTQGVAELKRDQAPRKREGEEERERENGGAREVRAPHATTHHFKHMENILISASLH